MDFRCFAAVIQSIASSVIQQKNAQIVLGRNAAVGRYYINSMYFRSFLVADLALSCTAMHIPLGSAVPKTLTSTIYSTSNFRIAYLAVISWSTHQPKKLISKIDDK